MKNQLDFIKSTVIRGFVFLVPAIIVVVALGKLIVVLKAMAKGLAPFFGIETLVGGLMLDILTFALIILLCFFAGLLAKRAMAKRVREKLDAYLLRSFPGYAFIKGIVENMRQTEEIVDTFVPVLVHFDDNVQIAFETERLPGDKVAVYLPGAPNPWSGSVVYVANERVKPLPMTLTEAVRNIRSLGKGPVDITGPI
jgi:uncharacterized membrane protein